MERPKLLGDVSGSLPWAHMIESPRNTTLFPRNAALIGAYVADSAARSLGVAKALVDCVDAVPRPRLLRAVALLGTSERLLAASSAPTALLILSPAALTTSPSASSSASPPGTPRIRTFAGM